MVIRGEKYQNCPLILNFSQNWNFLVPQNQTQLCQNYEDWCCEYQYRVLNVCESTSTAKDHISVNMPQKQATNGQLCSRPSWAIWGKWNKLLRKTQGSPDLDFLRVYQPTDGLHAQESSSPQLDALLAYARFSATPQYTPVIRSDFFRNLELFLRLGRSLPMYWTKIINTSNKK